MDGENESLLLPILKGKLEIEKSVQRVGLFHSNDRNSTFGVGCSGVWSRALSGRI